MSCGVAAVCKTAFGGFDSHIRLLAGYVLERMFCLMKIKLIFDAQFVGRDEVVLDVPDDITDEEIKALFSKHLGMDFDENCYWVKNPEQ